MRYREFVPHPLLRPYIKLIWTLSLDQPAAFGRPWKIAPDGIVEVVFQFGIPFSLRYPGESFERLPGSFAISQTRRFVEIRPAGPGGFLSIVAPTRVVVSGGGEPENVLLGFMRFEILFLPEPGVLLLLGAGALALTHLGRRRRRSAAWRGQEPHEGRGAFCEQPCVLRGSPPASP